MWDLQWLNTAFISTNTIRERKKCSATFDWIVLALKGHETPSGALSYLPYSMHNGLCCVQSVGWDSSVCVMCGHVDVFLLMKKAVYFKSVWPSVVLFFAMRVKSKEEGTLTLFKHFGKNKCLFKWFINPFACKLCDWMQQFT